MKIDLRDLMSEWKEVWQADQCVHAIGIDDDNSKEVAKRIEYVFNHYLKSPAGQELLEQINTDIHESILYGHPIRYYH